MRNLDTPIQYVKGVGPQRSRILSKLGVETVSDMLYYLPFRYEDRSNFVSVKDAKKGDIATIRGEVKKVNNIRTKTGLDIFQLALDDGTGLIYGVWFHQPYLRRVFKVGQKIVLYGKVERYDKLQINHPTYEILKGDEEDSIHIGRIVPVYHLTQDITQRYLRKVAHKAISDYTKYMPDPIPTKLRARNKLVDIGFSVTNIHFPTNEENLKRAYRRIVFDEFFLLQLAIAVKKREVHTTKEGVSHVIDRAKARAFVDGLSFELTKGQRGAMEAIEEDMKSPRPMNRLIQGDVGSGKTILASYALLLTVDSGYQGAIMAPTEILAEQHYVTLTKIFMDYDINCVLLINGLSQQARREALQEIESGRADIVVGTHALIQEGVEFEKLGLAVIDEQHKFGVSQRAKLQSGQRSPDILLMTATPIPRTLALTVYGDLDVSVIKEMPAGRGDITTYWIPDAERETIYNFVREEVSKGRQAYVVYPRLEEEDAGGVKAAKFMYEELKERIFKDLKVGLIHGKMSAANKERVMEEFKGGDIDILVSTVVIEVGIDIPNASVMVIENAERFGLSQLHQLRGRIGRGKYESYCILVSDPKTESAEKRLSAMTESADGFQIAEEDFKLRGPGDIFGTRQHGLAGIRFGDVIRDMEIMELARREAFSLIEGDPEFKAYENRHLRALLERRFKGKIGFVKVG